MSKRTIDRIRWIIVSLGSLGAVTGGVILALSSASAQRGSATVPGTQLAQTQLPASSGFERLPGMTQIISGRTPLWMGKDGTGPYSETSVGFTASLQQGFVLSSAIKQFGTLGHGLALPLPVTFAAEHPGPAEVFDIVWSFKRSWATRKLLYDPQYNNSAPGTILLRSESTNGGRSWQIISAANGGMQEYLFKFVRGNHLIQVSVIGYRMSLSSARAVAAQAGSTQ